MNLKRCHKILNKNLQNNLFKIPNTNRLANSTLQINQIRNTGTNFFFMLKSFNHVPTRTLDNLIQLTPPNTADLIIKK